VFAERLIRAVGTSWQPQALVDSADPLVLSRQAIEELVARTGMALGGLKEVRLVPAAEDDVIKVARRKEWSFRAQLQCEKGDGLLSVTVMRVTQGWKVVAFSIELDPSRLPMNAWSPEVITWMMDRWRDEMHPGTARAAVAKACGCVVDEIRSRWSSPTEYAKDTDTHNRELARAGLFKRCQVERTR